ncbi:MAG: transcription-repair coupling factor [Actinobacteria bacterium]|nr:transcription-repair coupling factor [Actinomycetota bacterium]
MKMDDIAQTILERVLASDYARSIAERLESPGEVRIAASNALVPLLAAFLYRAIGGPLVVAVPADAPEMASDISCFVPGEAFHLPGPGAAGDWFRPYDETGGRRLKAARALRSGKIVIAGVEAIVGGVPGELPRQWPLYLEEGTEIDLERTLRLLVEGGYQREYTVEGWGKFALRGGILDVFPSTAERPVRLELVGDRVESLREFNVVTQRSSGRLESVEILPASDPGDAEAGGLDGATVVAVDPGLIETRAVDFHAETGLEPPVDSLLDEWGAVLPVDTMGGPGGVGEPAKEFGGDLQSAVRHWRKLASAGDDVFLLLDGRGQVDRARELWEEAETGLAPPRMGVGTLRRGFRIPPLGLAVFTSADLLGHRRAPRAVGRVSSGTPVTSYAELAVGGYAVHVDQGIGVYRGLTSREVLGVKREYLLLEYAKGDRLYVPTAQLAKVQRYVGSENPCVHRLRGREWSRSRRLARRSAERTARELFQLYLERKSRRGFAFSLDAPWQRELEDTFEHQDTPDQARATGEVKADMESDIAMDRLVCGDVGYGKTEVAVRAAMKAVMDSRQAAVLVPTTVLASQHFETFACRMAPFPVNVAMLSRFLSAAEQGRVVDGLRRGEVDVVIGTHRMLQDDVSFKDLGLLVVDEEQKFGVANKERLRRLARDVDALTLTATPIPRTLQMSLSGIRDISVIDTPPEDRRPVATYVGEFDMDLALHAIRYEVARGGQAFYVHNRVESIGRVVAMLESRLEDVSIAVAHGRMDEYDLERAMVEFADGLHDVLVCTTIIESGLDLPNVNTLVVDRADLLGLAQLYQIRGRVGRAGKRAYAYLFYPRREALTDTAVARLATISEMTPLGSGMRVAMRDLEIRGAGNLLGAEQSGQIEAVGFEMYCELLRESVEILKGEVPGPAREAVVELPVDAYIPEEYVSDEETRVEEYRRLIVAGRAGTLDEFARELEDRFGPPPDPVRRMLDVERLRRDAGEAGLETVVTRGEELQLKSFPAEERALEIAARSAVSAGICDAGSVCIDKVTRTLYLKLRLQEVKNRQELLLKWLELIIDDIIN